MMTTGETVLTTIRPGDAGYEQWNDRGVNLRAKGYPSAILPVTTIDELTIALQHAVDSGRRVVVRGGGHCLENFVGNTSVEMIIDISGMKGIRYDDEMNAIEVTAGTTLGEMHERLYNEWRVVLPSGEHPAIGIGGHIPGGAFGFLCRQHGLGVDYLQAVEILWVDKDRQVKKTIATRDAKDINRELWWAHTGGGAGNFGIVTRYWFCTPGVTAKEPARLLPSAPTLIETVEMEWGWEDIDETSFQRLVGNFGNWSRDNAPPDAKGLHLFATLHLFNRTVGKILLKGLVTEATANLAEEFITSINEGLDIPGSVMRKSLCWLEFALNPFPDIFTGPKAAFKAKDAFLCQPFTAKQLKVMHRYLTEWTDIPGGMIGLATYGGKVNTVSSDATATAQRSAILDTACVVGWGDQADEAKSLEWVRYCYRDLYEETGGVPVPGVQTGGCIIAHPDNDMADPTWNTSGIPWHTFYYQDNYPRLQQVKAAWDPCGIFRHGLAVEAE